MRQHRLFRVAGMFGDVPEQRQPDLGIQVVVAEDFTDEPHQLAVQYSALWRVLGSALWGVPGSGGGGECSGSAGRMAGGPPLRRGWLPVAAAW